MEILRQDRDGAIARLTMAAPERLNALSDEMLAALWTGPAGASVSAVDGTPTEEHPRGDFDVRPTV